VGFHYTEEIVSDVYEKITFILTYLIIYYVDKIQRFCCKSTWQIVLPLYLYLFRVPGAFTNHSCLTKAISIYCEWVWGRARAWVKACVLVRACVRMCVYAYVCVCVCVCVGRGRVVLSIQYAKRRRHIVICSLSGSTTFCHIINGTIFGKKLLNTKCVLIFSTTSIWNISHSGKNSAKYCHVKYLLFL
jgi:hypothetical protein